MKIRFRLVIGYSLLAALVLITLTGFGCRPRPGGGLDSAKNPLVVWGLWQESGTMQPLLAAFERDTKIKVEYRKIGSLADYEKTLLEALAQGRGPDVFVIHHTWVENKRGLMSSAPVEIVAPREVVEEFVDVISHDLIKDGQVYALPVSVDTLALYYNKDLYNANGVVKPPRTWDELHQVVSQITKVTRTGDIRQSAMALGTASNINRAPDILQFLMMQSGLSIYNSATRQLDMASSTGEQALTFYTDFSNKAKRVYTWDLQQNYSIDAFAEGETAMMLSYSYYLPVIRAKNPRLSFAVAPAPQISSSKIVNFASYWPFAVSNTSRSPQDAWRLVYFLASKDASLQINKETNTPPARRDSVGEFAQDPILGVFAQQSLTATSWPRADIVATDKVFNDMIDSVVTGKSTLRESLQTAHNRFSQLLSPS